MDMDWCDSALIDHNPAWSKTSRCNGKRRINKGFGRKSGQELITEVVTASGKVYPEIEVKISPDISGEIVELTVHGRRQCKERPVAGAYLC